MTHYVQYSRRITEMVPPNSSTPTRLMNFALIMAPEHDANPILAAGWVAKYLVLLLI